MNGLSVTSHVVENNIIYSQFHKVLHEYIYIYYNIDIDIIKTMSNWWAMSKLQMIT